MKTYLDCFPCFLDQALRAGRIVTNDEKKIKRILDEVGELLKSIPLESTPPESGRLIYQKVMEISGSPDPYREIKKESTEKALSLYTSLKEHIENSENRLLTAIKIAIAGNVIDFGASGNIRVEEDVTEALKKDFAVCDYRAFEKGLSKTSTVLYLGDNAGECVFDRILIEEMKKPVTYVVRGAPVINDATYDDAVRAGIEEVAKILSSGTDAPGTILQTCSDPFKRVYDNSAFIISKGQGNYEALSNERRPIFFLLKAKCHVIAKDIGVNKGDIVLKRTNMWPE
jgi:uncharacterized protein with ATP-grasp and redox domains